MTYIDTVPPPPLRTVCCAQARTFGKKIDPGAAGIDSAQRGRAPGLGSWPHSPSRSG